MRGCSNNEKVQCTEIEALQHDLNYLGGDRNIPHSDIPFKREALIDCDIRVFPN